MSAVLKVMLRKPLGGGPAARAQHHLGTKVGGEDAAFRAHQGCDAERRLAGARGDVADLLARRDVGRLDQRCIHARRLLGDLVRPPVPMAPAPGPVSPHEFGFALDRVRVHGPHSPRPAARVKAGGGFPERVRL